MEKYAAVKLNAFNDELEKLGVAGMVAKLLTQALPKLLSLGSKGGAAFRTAMAAGKGSTAAATHFAGKGLRDNTIRFLTRAGEKGWGARKIYDVGMRQAARKWADPRINMAAVKVTAAGNKIPGAPTVRASVLGKEIGGLKGAVSATAKPGTFGNQGFLKNPMEWARTRPRKWFGEAAQNLDHINRRGLGNFMKHTWKDSQTFTKGDFKYARTPMGRVTSPLMNPAIGFPAFSFAMGGKDPVTGDKVGLVKRTGRALGEAATWSIAPSAAMAALTPGLAKDGYSLAKSFI